MFSLCSIAYHNCMFWIAKLSLNWCMPLPCMDPATLTTGVVVCAGTQRLEWGWRLSVGLAAVPAVILFIGSLVLPETPNSLIERNKHEQVHLSFASSVCKALYLYASLF